MRIRSQGGTLIKRLDTEYNIDWKMINCNAFLLLFTQKIRYYAFT